MTAKVRPLAPRMSVQVGDWVMFWDDMCSLGYQRWGEVKHCEGSKIEVECGHMKFETTDDRIREVRGQLLRRRRSVCRHRSICRGHLKELRWLRAQVKELEKWKLRCLVAGVKINGRTMSLEEMTKP